MGGTACQICAAVEVAGSEAARHIVSIYTTRPLCCSLHVSGYYL